MNMLMKKMIFMLLTVVFTSFIVNGQKDVEFDKKNFKDQKSEFKEALKALKQADELMSPAPVPKYKEAIDFYKQAFDFNQNSAYVNYQLGICYLNTVNKFSCLKYFESAFALNPKKFPDIQYYLGRGNHLNANWDKAIDHYKLYFNKLDSKSDQDEMLHVNKLIEECRVGKKLVNSPVRVWIDNMSKAVNSIYPEYGMIMTADASEIYFTSRRDNTTGGKKDEFINEYFEDVYRSKRLGQDKWSNAENIGGPINTKGHDAAVALSPDGSKMIVYIDDKGDGNLYESIRKGDEWSKPKIFNKEISGPYHEPSAWYSSDGKYLYFVSDRPLEKKGDAKDKDIYVATWNADKEKWLDVERLPETVNSPYDEDGIFLHPDGKTLYFSSKGHESMGGYDVFKTVKNDDGSWSKPENLGYPINTPDDDVFFVVAANGRIAYMTSFREGGMGDKDLYKVTFLGKEKEPVLNTENILLARSGKPTSVLNVAPEVEITGSKMAILKGIIVDSKSNEPLKAEVELIDNEKNELVATFTSDEVSGKYLVSLPAGKNYGIAVKKDGYLFHSENINIKNSLGYVEVDKTISLKKVNVGEEIVLKNIFFDLNKFSLREESQNELNRLIGLMNDNPSLIIEIGGHTDSRGAQSYNQKLSENRAKTVVDYLIQGGIDANRLSFKGYGMNKPIVSDDEIAMLKSNKAKEDAHQENRRTAFKVVKK